MISLDFDGVASDVCGAVGVTSIDDFSLSSFDVKLSVTGAGDCVEKRFRLRVG